MCGDVTSRLRSSSRAPCERLRATSEERTWTRLSGSARSSRAGPSTGRRCAAGSACRCSSELMGASGAHAVLEAIVEDPLTVVRVQEDLGLDPILVTVDDRWFSMHHYWRMLYSLPDEAADTWRVQARSEANGDFTRYHFTATTPGGDLTWSYDVGGYQVGELERPVKTAADVELLARYMPAPELLDQTRLTRARGAGRLARLRHAQLHRRVGRGGEHARPRRPLHRPLRPARARAPPVGLPGRAQHPARPPRRRDRAPLDPLRPELGRRRALARRSTGSSSSRTTCGSSRPRARRGC